MRLDIRRKTPLVALLFTALLLTPAVAAVPPLQPLAGIPQIERQLIDDGARITDFDGDTGANTCVGTAAIVPQKTPTIHGLNLAWVVGALKIAILLVALAGTYASLANNADWTYSYSITCKLDNWAIYTSASGGVARELTLYDARGNEQSKCDYAGVLKGHCTARYDLPTETWFDEGVGDILPMTATPCIHPDAFAYLESMVDRTGLVMATHHKTFSDFHPEGLCASATAIEWHET